jgi:hypothetical protein
VALTPIFRFSYFIGRVPRQPGNATQPQNLYSPPAARFAARGVMAFEHFGQIGAAAANISGRDNARRILLVELPMPLFFVRFMSRDSDSGAAAAR